MCEILIDYRRVLALQLKIKQIMMAGGKYLQVSVKQIDFVITLIDD